MEEVQPGAAAKSSPRRLRRTLTAIAKVIIAVAVIAGLWVASRSALRQWERESSKLQQEIAELTRQAEATSDPQQRMELEARRGELMRSMPRLENMAWDRIGAAGLLYTIGLIPPSFLLRRSLSGLGQRPRLKIAIAAQLIGHVGKYVPGKAMVVVLRAGALSRDGVRPLAATMSVFLETFLMMAVGATVAGLVTLWLPVPSWIAMSAAAVGVLASLPTLPPILRRIAAMISKTSLQEVHPDIGIRLFLAGWAWSLLSWILIGAAFTMLITAIPTINALPPILELYAIATAAISLAMVVGFASLLPGGAGVRELVLTTVLSVSIGTMHGLLAAIAIRLMSILIETILFLACWWWLRHETGTSHIARSPDTVPE